MKSRYTPEQIALLKNDPNIKEISENRLRFTLAFRQKIYDAVKDKISMSAVRRFLTEEGYDCSILGLRVIDTLAKNFKEYGRPVNGGGVRVKKLRSEGSEADDEFLLNTGKFIRAGNGIRFTDTFVHELFSAYPEQSIEDGIRKAGIDPDIVGYQRIRSLKRILDGGAQSEKRVRKEYSEELIRKYTSHPYVKRITEKQFVLKECFYNEAVYFADMKINGILEMYEITPDDLTVSCRTGIHYRLKTYSRTQEKQEEVSEQVVRIQHRRAVALEKILHDDLKEYTLGMDCSTKKKLCLLLQGFPFNRNQGYTLTKILKLLRISRSSYYSILNNNSYGMSECRREIQDQKDIETIKSVIAYRGFRKGARQIYMDMKDITGVQFGLKKIRRLMRKAGISSGIRKANQSRRSANELLKRNRKPNLLKRRFKLYEPDTVRLTDVTYIDYGKNLRAYGSAVKDSVTGRIIDFTIRDTNDLSLVLNSLKAIKEDGTEEGMILHSDQGALYLTDTFQNEVKSLGICQSMSKRGNCWDNAPQESFFGHFKDEADYQSCRDLQELIVLCRNYVEYYNTERHQWNLNKMTPVQYSEYLKNMTPQEKEERMRKEEIRYAAMKKCAEEEAVLRAVTLGV